MAVPSAVGIYCAAGTADLRMRRRQLHFSILALVAVAGLSALAPAAGADQIRPLYIGGVRLGMTHRQVRHALGSPRFATVRREYGIRERQWHYGGRLTVAFERFRHIERVFRVRTRSPRDRFMGGIHVGTREARVRHRLYGERCVGVSGYRPWPRGYVCTWTPPWITYGCGPSLSFYMRHRHGRVRYIELLGIPKRYARVGAVEHLGCF